MWKTTLRSLRAHKVRLVSTALAVVLGVAFMAGTLVLTDTVGRSFDDLLTTANAGVDVAVRGREQVAGDAMSGQRPGLDQDLVAAVAAVDGVAAAEGYVEGYAQIVGSDGEPIGDPGAGAPTFGQSWIGTDALNPWTLAEGAAPAGPDEVVIDRASAHRWPRRGDDVTVLSGGAPHVPPRRHRQLGCRRQSLGASAALFDLATAQDVLQRPGEVSSIEAVAADGVTQDTLAARVRAAVGDDVEVLTGEALTAELRSDVAESLAFFDTFLLAFALIALFVGSFIIYNTFTIVVAQRTRAGVAAGHRRRSRSGASLGADRGGRRRRRRLRPRPGRRLRPRRRAQGRHRRHRLRPAGHRHRDRAGVDGRRLRHRVRHHGGGGAAPGVAGGVGGADRSTARRGGGPHGNGGPASPPAASSRRRASA
ncbi:MAG: ABC transporter permease [Acidimicrobiales bacterium]